MNWELTASRFTCVNQTNHYIYALGDPLEKTFGCRFHKVAVYHDGNTSHFYIESEDLQQLTDYFTAKLDDIKFYRELNKRTISTAESFIEYVKKFEILSSVKKSNENIEYLKNKTNEEIVEIFKETIQRLYYELFPSMWIYIFIEELCEEKLYEIINKRFETKSERDHAIRTVTLPEKMTYIVEEELDMLHILRHKQRGFMASGVEQFLLGHSEKYSFMPLYDLTFKPYDIKHFKKKFDNLKIDAKENIDKLNDEYKKRRQNFNDLLGEGFSDYEKEYLKFMHEFVFIKDNRSLYRSLHNKYLKYLYEEIAERLYLKFDEVAAMTDDEIIMGIEDGIVNSHAIEERLKSFVYTMIDDNFSVLIEDQVKDFVEKQIEKTDKNRKSLEGKVAYEGKVKGRVRIVHTVKDLNIINDGDIMVTNMTRPVFMSAIKKAAAIVTDEGGVTCHAAIVSRELKIPCIVGTKNATKMFENGDLVEVDADNGIVRKIK